MEENNINSFTLYREYINLIDILPSKKRINFIVSIIDYVFFDTEPLFNSKEEKAIWQNLLRPINKAKNKSNNARKEETKQNQNEIKMKSNENQSQNTSDVNVNVYVNNNNLFKYIEDNFGRTLNSIEYEKISLWEDNDLTRYAIKEAVLNGAYNLKYIETILTNFKKNNIKTVVEAQEYSKKFKESKNAGKSVYEDFTNEYK